MKYVSLVSIGLGGLMLGCDSGGSSTVPTNVGAAIGGLFSSSGDAKTYRAVVETCGEFEDEEGSGGGPSGVSTTASITAGTFGSTSASVTVTAEDDCESNNNNEDAFASFTLTADVAGDCESGTDVTMLEGSTGIWRNTSEYEPEIYGTFNFSAGGTTFTGVKCTIRMSRETGAVDAATSSCEDSAGGAISLSSSDTCTFGGE